MNDLADLVRAGDRRALARAITLVESTRPDHRSDADALIEAVLPDTGDAVRIGITGPPGVGKSTFIEAFGTALTADGRKVAVLAVDPSSSRSGGSILGDKTRMEALAKDPNAFVRPSPAGTELGGVARRTREAMLLCEAAGFDVLLVETVGVGQAELAVADLVDLFVLLAAPGAGDELQGIKRGIVELADVLVVNKADGELKPAAEAVRSGYGAALRLLRPATPGWTPPALTCSARTGAGIEEAWQAVLRHRAVLDETGELEAKRARQARSWLRSEVQAGLIAALREDPATAALLAELEAAVEAGELLPARAARRLVERFRAAAQNEP